MSVLAVDPVYGSDELVEVAVTRHLDCECGCRIEADDCDPSIQVVTLSLLWVMLSQIDLSNPRLTSHTLEMYKF